MDVWPIRNQFYLRPLTWVTFKQHGKTLFLIISSLLFASCSLSMVPTIYGMRLTNHFILGSPSPVKLHEKIAKDQFLILKWQNVTDFAGNFKLDFSPVLRNAIDKLAASRFFSVSRTFSEYPLNTYLHILDSFSIGVVN